MKNEARSGEDPMTSTPSDPAAAAPSPAGTAVAGITPRGVELKGRPPESFDPVGVARDLLFGTSSAALATLDPGTGFPLTTLVNVAAAADGAPVFLASALSLHTRNIDADSRISLLLADIGKGDPAAHPRLTVVGSARRSDDPALRERFLARHPKAKLYADFPDFSFFVVEIAGFHLNGGFARAAQLTPQEVLGPA